MATIIIRDRQTYKEINQFDFPIRPQYQALTNELFRIYFYNDAKRLLLQLSDEITCAIVKHGYDRRHLIRSEEIYINDKITVSDLFHILI